MEYSMIRVADYIAKVLISEGVTDIFMLTGYGAMYLNDAIGVSGIRHYATRNEATAPMMAEAYARLKNCLGVVCVTAGPGCTNAVPGLAEAYVDSGAILVLSGQVERSHTVCNSGDKDLRTFGTAEINIIPVVAPITKFAAEIDDPSKVRYLLEKAIHLAKDGRPGPVWLSIPIDVQQSMINESELEAYTPQKASILPCKAGLVANELRKAKRPLIVGGHGVRQSDSIAKFKELIGLVNAPVVLSRLGQDLVPHSLPNVFGHAGVKGQHYCKDIMSRADVILVLGCRLAVQFVGMKFQHFDKQAKIIMVDIDESELNKPGIPLYMKIHYDLKKFIPELIEEISISLPEWAGWLEECENLRKEKPLLIKDNNPIDLYFFMSELNDASCEKHVITTDAGSNYYVGGQVLSFNRGQREITSGAFAAMGLSIPLAIGCAVAQPQSQILAITGDGSLELNIQELKTISHYKFNIKVFVINNGGYVSMKKWQDTFFEGRRIDEAETTGVGTLNLKKIADAFDLPYMRIDDAAKIRSQLSEIMSNNGPLFVEVATDNNQIIQDA
jgi:acetolactate synthase-1/2/3 large subunit